MTHTADDAFDVHHRDLVGWAAADHPLARGLTLADYTRADMQKALRTTSPVHDAVRYAQASTDAIDASEQAPPLTAAQKREMVDLQSPLVNLYDKTVSDPARHDRFLERFDDLYTNNPEEARRLGALGKNMANLTPQEIGTKLADIYKDTLSELIAADPDHFNPGSEASQELNGIFSGMLIAARGNFQGDEQKLRDVVGSFNKEWGSQTSITASTGSPLDLFEAVISVSGEPSMEIGPDRKQDPYHYQMK